MDNLFQWLHDRHNAQGSSHTLGEKKDWKFETAACPKQHDSNDCGVFMIQYVDYLTRGLSLNFTQNDMAFFRQRLCIDILIGKLWSDNITKHTDSSTDCIPGSVLNCDDQIKEPQCDTLQGSDGEHDDADNDEADYRDLSTDEEESEEFSGKAWIRKRSNFQLKGYGNTALLVTRKFQFTDMAIKEDNSRVSNDIYMITDVVFRKQESEKLFFQYYNTSKLRTKTHVKNENWGFIEASKVLSTNARKKFVKLIAIDGELHQYYGKALIGRICRTTFKEGRSLLKVYKGKITDYDKETQLYTVSYCDGDNHEHPLDLVLASLRID